MREIVLGCDPRATAVAANSRYSATCKTSGTGKMLAYVINEGRLFELKPSEWAIMLGGVALCGLMALLFL